MSKRNYVCDCCLKNTENQTLCPECENNKKQKKDDSKDEKDGGKCYHCTAKLPYNSRSVTLYYGNKYCFKCSDKMFILYSENSYITELIETTNFQAETLFITRLSFLDTDNNYKYRPQSPSFMDSSSYDDPNIPPTSEPITVKKNCNKCNFEILPTDCAGLIQFQDQIYCKRCGSKYFFHLDIHDKVTISNSCKFEKDIVLIGRLSYLEDYKDTRYWGDQFSYYTFSNSTSSPPMSYDDLFSSPSPTFSPASPNYSPKSPIFSAFSPEYSSTISSQVVTLMESKIYNPLGFALMERKMYKPTSTQYSK